MNVIAYTRVSTDGQCGEDKFGLEVQRERIQSYCVQKGYTILRWYIDEGESGAKERPGFDSIVYGDEAENPPVEAVIVAKSDRVARDINVYYYYKMLLQKKNIKLISITEDFGQYGVFASMLEAFTLCVAEMERENITRRTMSGRIAKARTGGYAGGPAPLGYKAHRGELIVDEEEAETVRRIFELNAQGVSMRKIAAIVNDEGRRNRIGKPFLHSSIQSVLENRKFYQGFYRYRENGVMSDWVKGQHKPIIK